MEGGGPACKRGGGRRPETEGLSFPGACGARVGAWGAGEVGLHECVGVLGAEGCRMPTVWMVGGWCWRVWGGMWVLMVHVRKKSALTLRLLANDGSSAGIAPAPSTQHTPASLARMTRSSATARASASRLVWVW